MFHKPDGDRLPSNVIRALACAALVIAAFLPAAAATVGGELTRWHEVTVDFEGPNHDEMDSSPNPFLDYRLQVRFTAPTGGRVVDVPGFFDGDGAGGGSGSVWRVRFAPDEAGTWTYEASFRTGTEVAVRLDPAAGTPTSFDGESGSFLVADTDPNAPGFLRLGRLRSVGEHYPRFPDGAPWVKLGTNNPENLLGYEGFDNTPYAWHSYANHVADWNPGDPDWDSPDTASTTDGRAIIGALNYLAEVGLNSIYFMPMNIGADGKDVWPYADPAIDRNGAVANDNLHFDISKLTQWEIVFDHAERKGLLLHWVLSDKTVANKNELDGATLGVERKLFYREMIARFGHHNATQWNICEEYNLDLPLDPEVIKQFGEHIAAVDPYDHPITVHSHGNTYKSALAPFLGEDWFRVMSVQTWQRPEDIGGAIEYFRDETTAANNPIPVNLDECIGMNQISADDYRKRTFWDALLSGGGFEMFKSSGDSDVDDFRVYAAYYEYAEHARRFVDLHLPFADMVPADELVTGDDPLWGGAEVLALEGEVYAVYLPKASPEPDLSLVGHGGTFEQTWYDPRTGQFEGAPRYVSGDAVVGLGAPPADPDEDWAILLRLADAPPVRSDGQPAGVLPTGTTETTLSLATDIDATCRYSTVPETPYDAMTEDFGTSGGTTHSTTVGGLRDGRAYAYNVRCRSAVGADNADDFVIHFEVAAPGDPPVGDRAVWYLDEGSGDVTLDASGNANTGYLLDGPAWVAGFSGSGLRFDGATSHVRVEDSPVLDYSAWPGAAFAAWVRPERLDHADEQTIYGHWSSATSERTFQIILTTGNELRCRTNHDDGYVTSPAEVAAGTWTHVACTWSPAGLTLYVDGRPVATDDVVESDLDNNPGIHTFGVREKTGAYDQWFEGRVDEAHVFGRALTADEVLRLYESVECVDGDADGVRACDDDCDDANPECAGDCTDADGDGICAARDCDDATPSAGSTFRAEFLRPAAGGRLSWVTPADIRWRKGDLAEVATYATLEAGTLLGVTSIDLSADAPGDGQGFYYVVRDLGCGSWQTAADAEPGRDAALPLP